MIISLGLGEAVGVVGLAILVLTIYLSDIITSACTRATALGISTGGRALRGILGRVRGRSRFLFFCGLRRVGGGRGVSVGRGGTGVRAILSTVTTGANLGCAVGSHRVILASRTTPTSATAARRGHGIANAMDSTFNPITNTGIVRGNAAGNAAASVSKGFSVRIPTGTALRVSFVKCVPRSVIIGGRGIVGILLGRSARTLRRIVIINCNAVGGGSVANTITSIGVSSAPITAISAIDRTLTNGTTNLRIDAVDTRPNKRSAFHVHNTTSSSGTKGSPLVVVSNFPIGSPNSLSDNGRCSKNGGSGVLTSVGPGSVRSVRILGSTDSATVCNTHTNGNIVVIAAGQNGDKTTGMRCSKSTSMRRVTGSCRVLSTSNFVQTAGSCAHRR